MHFIKHIKTCCHFLVSITKVLFSVTVFILCVCSCNNSFAQEDETKENKEIILLHKESYEELETKFWKSISSEKGAEPKYAKAHLLKAKKERDTAKIADGYYMMLYAFGVNTSEQYIDSVIAITLNNINLYQPARVYLIRANQYGATGRYKEAFIALDKANLCAKTSGNIDQLYHIKYLIARLKTDVGEYQSSLNILKDVVAYHKEKDNLRSYIIASWAYGSNLNSLNRTDSALSVSEEIIPLSLTTQDSIFYDRLLLSSAISYFDKGNYIESLERIYKLREFLKGKDVNNSIDILMNLYLGKIYFQQKKDDLAIKSLKMVDSISMVNNYFHFSLRENYTLLYQYYKKRNDAENQLHYINKLLVADSVLDVDFKYIVTNVNRKYTIPNLIVEKQKIIESFVKKGKDKAPTNSTIVKVVSLIILVLLVVIVLGFFRKKNKAPKEEVTLDKKEMTYIIDDKTAKRILEDLHKIEQSELLLNQDMNLGTLAKLLKTNTSYLSRIINEHKKLTFKQYLIEYRINSLMKELEKNPMIRRYSIEALAASIGYNNASSFTRIFKKHIGVSPSEFLREKYG